jgi:hypothetical protein
VSADPRSTATGRALFVPTLAAARAVRARGAAGFDHWTSFNLCVVAECEVLGTPCVDLHGFLEATEPRENLDVLRPAFGRLLLALDAVHGDRLNRSGQAGVSWYFSFYRYLGLLEYAGLALFDRAMGRYLAARGIGSLSLAGAFTPGLAALTDDDYREVLATACTAAGVELTVCPVAEPAASGRRRARAAQQVRALAGSVRQLVRRQRMVRGSRGPAAAGCTLLIEPFYEAACLPVETARVCVWPVGGPHRRSPRVAPEPAGAVPSNAGAVAQFADLPHVGLYARAMTRHLEASRPACDRALAAVGALVARHGVTQAVWGTSPAAAAPDTLVVEWLRRQGIRVFGVQHGGSYGDQPLDDLHLLSDYLYCDEFLAYGAQPRDLPERPTAGLAPAAIVAVGSLKETVRAARSRRAKPAARDRADILFPVSLAHDLGTGVPLAKGDDMRAWQRAIVRHLDRLAVRVVIKPLRRISQNPAYVERYFPAAFDLQHLAHCEVDESCSYEEALDRYAPRLVILDWLSTTLQESLAHDVDILQLIDPVCPPKSSIRDLLEDRVYWAHDVPDLVRQVDQFVAGALAPRRGTAYYQTYVQPAGNAVTAAALRLGWRA